MVYQNFYDIPYLPVLQVVTPDGTYKIFYMLDDKAAIVNANHLLNQYTAGQES